MHLNLRKAKKQRPTRGGQNPTNKGPEGFFGGVLTVDRQGLLCLIDTEAQKLGMRGDEALERIKRGTPGDSYLWTDIAFLADLLPYAK